MNKRYRVGIIYTIVIICALLLRIASSEQVYKYFNADSDYFFTLIVQLFCFGFVPLILYLVLCTNRKKDAIVGLLSDFNFKKPSLRNMLRAIVIAICMLYIATILSYIWSSLLRAVGYTYSHVQTQFSSIWVLLLELLMTAVLPAIFEEFTHRGLLFSGYKDSGYRVVLISALLFALMHQNIRQTCYTFFDGLVLALIVYYSGSIFPAMLVHFINNAVSVLWDYGDYTGNWLSFMTNISDWIYGSIAGYVVGGLITILAGAVMVLLFYRMRKDGVKNGIIKKELFDMGSPDAIPLHKDVLSYLNIILGVVVTTITLVWGIMR